MNLMKHERNGMMKRCLPGRNTTETVFQSLAVPLEKIKNKDGSLVRDEVVDILQCKNLN